jgi:hypothetical protein
MLTISSDDDDDDDDDDDVDADDDENHGIRKVNSIFVVSVPHWPHPLTNPRLFLWLETLHLLFKPFTACPAPRHLQLFTVGPSIIYNSTKSFRLTPALPRAFGFGCDASGTQPDSDTT